MQSRDYTPELYQKLAKILVALYQIPDECENQIRINIKGDDRFEPELWQIKHVSEDKYVYVHEDGDNHGFDPEVWETFIDPLTLVLDLPVGEYEISLYFGACALYI